MTKVSVLEARQQLTNLAKRVEAGEDIVITYRGKDLVRLVPVAPPLPDLSEFRAGLERLDPGEPAFSDLAEEMRDDRV